MRATLTDLTRDRTPPGVKALTGHDGVMRVRVGDWRIVYRVEHARLIVLVLDIDHRSQVYRRSAR